MTQEPDRDAMRPKWMRIEAACKYLDIKPSLLLKKLADGSGPLCFRRPGSKTRLFFSADLDSWVRNSPVRPLTQSEIERSRKLQEAADRGREEKRAEQRAKTEEDVSA
jgi:hypothetical protein